MKNLKHYLVLVTVAAALLVAPGARAEGPGFFEVLGDVFHFITDFVGETKLTPAYQVETWSYQLRQKNMTTFDPAEKISLDFSLGRNRLTGHWTYWYKSNGGVYGTNTSKEPYGFMHIDTKRWACTRSVPSGGTTNRILTIEHETHTEFVYVAHVERTGMVPDDGPWTVWLKTRSQKLSCAGVISPPVFFSWISADISRGQGQVVTLGLPNVVLQYPFYLADESYK